MASQPDRAKTILVVEDQDEVRGIMARALKEVGYTVIEAIDGQEAFDLMAGGLRIDMLVMDVILPRLGGVQLAERLNSLPGSRPAILFTSGYDQDRTKVPGPFLQKPFTPDSLIAEVQRLIG
jgi:two-component system, cell cycle sensor histidine kinase and response regulator CckA